MEVKSDRSSFYRSRSSTSPRRKSFTEKYDASLIRSKAAILVVILASIVEYLQFLTITILIGESSNSWVIGLLVSFYLFYPLLGYIGERVTRYKVLVAGIIIINFAAFTVFGLFVLDFNTDKNKVFELLIAALKIVGLAMGVLGAGLFNANIIQFGTDQIQFGSSKDMVTFARWFMLFYSLAVLLSGILRPLVAILSSKTILLYGTGGVIISASITALLLSILFKKSFIIDRPVATRDPVKQICGVLNYAKKYKTPAMRSAFTYGDDSPSRLDLAKERYGGPFTSRQVEDVKSFWSILVIIVLSTYFALNYKSGLAKEYLYIAEYKNETVNDAVYIIFNSQNMFQGGITIVGIILLEALLVPFFPRCVPSMLKRLWIGIAIIFLSTTVTAGLNIAITNREVCLKQNVSDGLDLFLPPYQVILVPYILAGIGILFVYVTSLEFILAQAPYRMQGLLIGFWFLQFPSIILQEALGLIPTVHCSWEYYVVITASQLMFMLLYTLVAWRYKPRQCNELSEINVRENIEKIYQRNIERAIEETEREETERRLWDQYVLITD